MDIDTPLGSLAATVSVLGRLSHFMAFAQILDHSSFDWLSGYGGKR
jgi:hypothetical protein